MSEQLTGRVDKFVTGYITVDGPPRRRFSFRIRLEKIGGGTVTFKVEPVPQDGKLPRAIDIKLVEVPCSSP